MIQFNLNAKLIHAVKVAQILVFVAKMACVVMKIMYLLVMQLPIIPMSVDVFVLITFQVCSNIAITLRGFSETDSPDFVCFMMSFLEISYS